jgi:adenine-specific DNA-methyltransferase
MPTLQFKGKNIIWNHHLSIPYHTLDEVENLHFQSEKADGNLIIEGDNLLALKALLPQYAGKVKCIYIDPPYNTGNEGWVYNDNVNSPMLKEWLGKEVGKDDLTRHDKWLCMMVPRLKLLRELLADDGSIFISIDDNEQHTLRMVMDEILGEEHFVTNIIWQKKYAASNDAKYFSDNHDFILCYAKNKLTNGNSIGWERNLLPRSDKQDSLYKYDSNDGKGLWRPDNLTVKTYSDEYDYPILNPNTGKEYFPTKGRCWVTNKTVMEKWIKEGRVFFGQNGKGAPQLKRYLSEVQMGIVPLTVWLYDEVGHTDSSRKVLKDLFYDSDTPFDNPKPVELIKRIIQIAAGKDTIILDSFAGSGTTMHAVMDLNKEDGGNRRCILIQMTEATESEPDKNICKEITRERVKRAIEKFGYDSGFQYYRIGIPIDAETLLSGELPTFQQFAEYVYYLCTGESLKEKTKINEEDFFVGEHGNSVLYLVYKQNFYELTRLALNLELAERVTAEHPKKKIIVYAPACFLEEDYMREKNIDYVGIPYNLYRHSGV